MSKKPDVVVGNGGGFLPSSVRLEAKNSRQITTFEYEEFFNDKRYGNLTRSQLLDNTVAMIQRATERLDAGLEVTRTRNSIVISGRVPRSKFGDMMVSEFMAWGDIANISLKQILAAAALMAGRP